MSVRVNLLPREYEERAATRRAAGVAALLVLLLVAILAILQFLKLADIDRAVEERDAAQAEVNRLQAEVARLQEYASIAARLEAGNQILINLMEGEVSWARVLNDLALSFPSTASLTDLQAALLEEQAAQLSAGDVFEDNEAEDIGFLTFTGYSIERFAPGVEAVLIRLGDIQSFFQSYLAQAAVEEIGDVNVTGFTGEVRLDATARTGRYAEGLPPEGPR